MTTTLPSSSTIPLTTTTTLPAFEQASYGEVAEDVSFVIIPILVLVGLGWLLGKRKTLAGVEFQTCLKVLNSFMFTLGIPSLVFKALASKDFNTFNWNFLSAFLVLRVFTGLACVFFTWIVSIYQAQGSLSHRCTNFSIGNFLMHWIGTTWLNSVIFGIPILKALYGPTVVIFNVLAAMSSILFQLPLMLFLFEWRNVRKDHSISDIEMKDHSTTNHSTTDIEMNHDSTISRQSLISVIQRALLNPPIIGIMLGLLYGGAITTAMSKEPDDFPQVLDYLSTWLGDTVTPLAAFCVGLFINAFDFKAFLRVWWISAIYILCKHMLVPLLMIPILFMFDISDVEARCAIHIASLPIALSSFVLSQKYHLNTHVIDATIIIGTILILPTALIWEALLDVLNL